jgi:hypothetical protein
MVGNFRMGLSNPFNYLRYKMEDSWFMRDTVYAGLVPESGCQHLFRNSSVNKIKSFASDTLALKTGVSFSAGYLRAQCSIGIASVKTWV